MELQRPPLVLQHGFLGGAGDWLPLFATFGRHFDVIAPDFPGFAGSGEIEAPDSVAGFADALLGHSMGSMVALQIALDRTGRLVLYGSTCTGKLRNRFEPFETSIARLDMHGVDACPIASCRLGSSTARRRLTSRCAGKLAATSAPRPPSAPCVHSAIGTCANGSGSSPHLTLIICGDRDRSTPPDQSYRLWEEIPDARPCIVPGCAHNVHLERPELYSRIVLDFLTEG